MKEFLKEIWERNEAFFIGLIVIFIVAFVAYLFYGAGAAFGALVFGLLSVIINNRH